MFCSACGNKLSEEARFCGKCGTPVAVVTDVPGPQYQPQQVDKEQYGMQAIAPPQGGFDDRVPRPAKIVRRYGKLKAFFSWVLPVSAVLDLLYTLSTIYFVDGVGGKIKLFLYGVITAAIMVGPEILIIKNTLKITPFDERKRTIINMIKLGFKVYVNVSVKIALFAAFIVLWFFPWLGKLGFDLDKYKSDYTMFDVDGIKGVTKIGDNLYSDKEGNLYYAEG